MTTDPTRRDVTWTLSGLVPMELTIAPDIESVRQAMPSRTAITLAEKTIIDVDGDHCKAAGVLISCALDNASRWDADGMVLMLFATLAIFAKVDAARTGLTTPQ